MRLSLALVLMALLGFPAHAIDADVPPDLHAADYITAVDVEAEVPYGELFIDRAVIAIFPRLEDRLSGMFIGQARLNFRKLPEGGGLASVASEGRARLRVSSAYLAASPVSDYTILPKGRALAARRWDGLSRTEQQQFLELYNRGLGGTWRDATGEVRDPASKEFFAQFMAETPGAEPTEYEFRVAAAGDPVSLAQIGAQGEPAALPVEEEQATSAAPQNTSP